MEQLVNIDLSGAGRREVSDKNAGSINSLSGNHSGNSLFAGTSISVLLVLNS